MDTFDNELLLFDRIKLIKDTVAKYGEENFYISFSGGKDSTVLHYLIDEAIPNNKIPRVFINTGIEYIDLVKHVKELAKNENRIIVYNAGVNIKRMLTEKGYPFKSKEHSRKLSTYQNSSLCKSVKVYMSGIKSDGTTSRFACPKILKYQFDDQFSIKISDKCCDELKKKTAKRYEKESGRKIGIIGLRMSEGGQRANKPNCVVFDSKNTLVRFKPLNPLTNEFVEWYIERNNIKLCKLYYPPYNFTRTGCKGCPFAIGLDEQLEVMDRLMPNERKQCEILWKPIYDEYRRIGYRLKTNEQKKLF
ncbi:MULTISPECIES: phosphoadenosine phosphosulfate reductase family protein [unclassified Breznakia]|uniref:phosphoadenosine phosphosulfate reductase domain-containing protein n=1 Tax=unclassified Breznakia TaxID=2623764 RepID=UPI00247324A6|nr:MULTISPECIES: phosphoadenosine phosphosulfate reductase family protein [unclassified Breznakia]MDH6367151.1 3'-phosphoadenosine 5'-phosphosulfate sulfotransferase (PAPS reductase)/FAD synthetase [Breznakia sp. PH1-1]MDH6404262.1 3'-phosphoadenosine 5'-phosphosulfate sulfotransferase (PAPS reductase)/FAD synthetase [Breznakia sp. PF1-11]MDH6412039.1 3'-phosphoadenosine 5'-phosphosulfate sulfotransferase (PAPS reductase)/FAD synthetase [Breznakia sp. PFB1-11]MDH6414250.1 3'-phosphoadenosine 5'